jgi:hypothetical protein
MITLLHHKISKQYPTIGRKTHTRIEAALYSEAVNKITVWLVLAVVPMKRSMKIIINRMQLNKKEWKL